jgi:hypothetical protein
MQRSGVNATKIYLARSQGMVWLVLAGMAQNHRYPPSFCGLCNVLNVVSGFVWGILGTAFLGTNAFLASRVAFPGSKMVALRLCRRHQAIQHVYLASLANNFTRAKEPQGLQLAWSRPAEG